MSVKEDIVSSHDCESRPEIHHFIMPLLNQQTHVLLVGRRPRGRPIGSKNKPEMLRILTRGNYNALRSHTIKINDGVNIMKRLFDFSKHQKRDIIILSGNRMVAKARFPQFNGGITTLHGRFDILSISGTILPPPKLKSEERLAISRSVFEENVFGGSVIPPLIASGPVTLYVLSFANTAVEKLSSVANDHIKSEP